MGDLTRHGMESMRHRVSPHPAIASIYRSCSFLGTAPTLRFTRFVYPSRHPF